MQEKSVESPPRTLFPLMESLYIITQLEKNTIPNIINSGKVKTLKDIIIPENVRQNTTEQNNKKNYRTLRYAYFCYNYSHPQIVVKVINHFYTFVKFKIIKLAFS